MSGRNTEGAILAVCSKLYHALNKSKPALALFLDFRKAFDTVPHCLLLDRLQRIGIRGVAFKIFQSYLAGRTQKVKLRLPSGDFLLSDTQNINCGVLQGTILGPLLFAIFINDLCKAAIPGGQITTYADDTVVVFTGDSWEIVFN